MESKLKDFSFSNTFGSGTMEKRMFLRDGVIFSTARELISLATTNFDNLSKAVKTNGFLINGISRWTN